MRCIDDSGPDAVPGGKWNLPGHRRPARSVVLHVDAVPGSTTRRARRRGALGAGHGDTTTGRRAGPGGPGANAVVNVSKDDACRRTSNGLRLPS